MTKYVLNAQKRDLIGSKVKNLRKSGITPAVVFGKSVESLALAVNAVEFLKVYRQAGETSLIWLKVDGETKERPTLIKSMAFGPVKNEVLNIDFHQVNLKEKVTAFVPVELIGESELIHSGQAILSQNLNEIEVECLPTDIPEKFEIDTALLKEIGDSLKVSDLKASSEVEIITDLDSIVVSLSEPQKEEEPLDTTVAEAEVAGEEGKEKTESETSSEEKSKE
jgi:large subunit ribosomal protein L25